MAEEVPPTMELVSDASKPFAAMGRMLRALRDAKKLSQEDVADRAGFSNNRVSEVEQGKNVRLDTLQRYAVGLGYRSFIEMLRAPHDDSLRKLLKVWPALDEAERKALADEARDFLSGKRE